MSAVAEDTLITPEEFLRMPDQKGFELIDGVLVARHGESEESRVSLLSSWVGGELFAEIHAFCKGKGIGWVFPADGGFQCFPDRPRTVRQPDISFGRSASTSRGLKIYAPRDANPGRRGASGTAFPRRAWERVSMLNP
jgi:hypothetical protein